MLALPSFPNLCRLQPIETQYSFPSPAHTEPAFILKIQNLAQMMFEHLGVLLLAGNERVKLHSTFHPQASEGYRPLIYVLI